MQDEPIVAESPRDVRRAQTKRRKGDILETVTGLSTQDLDDAKRVLEMIKTDSFKAKADDAMTIVGLDPRVLLRHELLPSGHRHYLSNMSLDLYLQIVKACALLAHEEKVIMLMELKSFTCIAVTALRIAFMASLPDAAQGTPLGLYPAPVHFFATLSGRGWASACKLMNREMIVDKWKGIEWLIHEPGHFYFVYWPFNERVLYIRDSMARRKVGKVFLLCANHLAHTCACLCVTYGHAQCTPALMQNIPPPFAERVRTHGQRPQDLD